tara:strand:+ start:104 stop:820 length:717 start_codon:yes stop_codon:yes gene_type:complete
MNDLKASMIGHLKVSLVEYLAEYANILEDKRKSGQELEFLFQDNSVIENKHMVIKLKDIVEGDGLLEGVKDEFLDYAYYCLVASSCEYAVKQVSNLFRLEKLGIIILNNDKKQKRILRDMRRNVAEILYVQQGGDYDPNHLVPVLQENLIQPLLDDDEVRESFPSFRRGAKQRVKLMRTITAHPFPQLHNGNGSYTTEKMTRLTHCVAQAEVLNLLGDAYMRFRGYHPDLKEVNPTLN